MDRQIVYPGQIPLETDLLNTNKNTMFGLGFLAQAVLGTSTLFDGLACVPTAPASMQVSVGAGSVYVVAAADSSAYSSLTSDPTAIVKQGIQSASVLLTCAAPTTSGFSINYLIQASYADSDAGSTVLPFYNETTPSVAYSGPGNSGAASYTVRKGSLIINALAGAAASTGTQTTPSPSAGFTGLYVVTVANGATSITSGNIAVAAGAPFITSKLPAIATCFKSINQITISTSQTYTPSARAIAVWVRAIGAGGGGGGGAGGGGVAPAAGGASGAYEEGFYTAASLASGIAVTIGAAGNGGAAGNNNGTAGGNTLFGSYLNAGGGSPGGGSANGSAVTLSVGISSGGTPSGTASVQSAGNPGDPGIVFSSTIGWSGKGGSGPFGGGGPSRTNANTAGNAATGYGAGGGGALGGSAAQVGGLGYQGAVLITEYIA
jgi:hypothetical protein